MTRGGIRWLGGYEERVRFFLALLVFVLAAANAGNFLLLRSMYLSLRDAVEEVVEVRGSLAAHEIMALASPATEHATHPSAWQLSRIAERSGSLSLALLDLSGHVLAATDGTQPGVLDRDAETTLDLRERDRAGLALGLTTRLVQREALMLRFQVIADAGGRPVYLLKSIHDTAELASTGAAYRGLVWTQTIALLLVLIAAFVFSRWISRPYRLLAAEAARASGTAQGIPSDPEDLIAAIRRVVGQVRAQDDELRELHARAAARGGTITEFVKGAGARMASGLVAVDAAGRLQAANPSAIAILGIGVARPIGSELDAWAGSGAELGRLVKAALSGAESPTRVEIDHPGPGGKPMRLGVSVSPVEGEGGAVCLIADLTEVRELEQRVRRRDELAALGTISAGIAHEMRNALGTILGYARLAESSGPDAVQTHARAIAREVQAISGAVDRFLAYARPARAVQGSVPVRALLSQVVDEAKHAGHAPTLSVRIDGEEAIVRGEEQALRQAFANLIRNAAESSDGPVNLIIAIGREGDRVVIVFRDDGEGVPPENRDKIFLPFFTTRDAGTGMGLALAQKTILDHEGTIALETDLGPGASFRVVLPGSG